MSSSNAPISSPAACSPSLRVLLVEDDPATRETTAEMLTLLGHWTASVGSAEAARDRYIDGAFDVLMCDVGLPGLSGLDLMQSLHPAGVALLLVSGGRRPALLPPGCAWLSKPYGLDALEQVLAQLFPPPERCAPERLQPRVAEGGTGTTSPGPTASAGTAVAGNAGGAGTASGTAPPTALWPGFTWGAGGALGAGGT